MTASDSHSVRSVLSITNHRPWPMPQRPWVLHMTWHDLLFAHWRVAENSIRHLVPGDLELERFDGSAWLGVIPFYMTARPRGFPDLLKSRFNEVNVRTYVRHRGRPGVWFFSLDAAHRPAVWAARRFFHLPYHLAAMSSTTSSDAVLYYSRRKRTSDARLDCRYRPVKDEHIPDKGTLEHFLTERYSLFSANRGGQIFCGEIHHPPWRLHAAEAEIRINTMTKPLGLTLPEEEPLLHFARRQDVVAWTLAAP